MKRFKTARFSLIELLVIVAIIAILLSIMLPALKTARDKTLEISCANNEKQMFLGLNFYADNHDDIYPFYNYNLKVSSVSTQNKDTRWFACIGPLMGIPGCYAADPKLSDTPFICPATKSKAFMIDLARGRCGPAANDYYFCSYVMSAYITGQKRTRIRNKVYLVFDGYHGNAWATATSPHSIFRHNNSVMMLWTDGSVTKVKFSDFDFTSIENWRGIPL